MNNSSTVVESKSTQTPDQNQQTHSPTNQHHLFADLALLCTATLWGINIPVVKYAVGEIDAFVFNAIRLTIAMLVLGVFAWFENRAGRGFKGPFSKSRLVVFASLTGFFYMILFMFGVTRTTAGNVALLLTSMPMCTAVLSYLFIGERLGRVTWIGLLLTLIGTSTVVLNGGKVDLSEPRFLVGNLMMMGAALCWASGTIISRKLLTSLGPMTLAFLASVLTTPLHLMIVAPRMPTELPTMWRTDVVLATVYSGLFSTGLAYSLWHIGVRQLGSSHASVYQNFVTLVALLGSWFFLGEQPAAVQFYGGILIVAGVLIMRRGR
ncbi:MAG: DMT family transporter [Pirellulaceae bacterium]